MSPTGRCVACRAERHVTPGPTSRTPQSNAGKLKENLQSILTSTVLMHILAGLPNDGELSVLPGTGNWGEQLALRCNPNER